MIQKIAVVGNAGAGKTTLARKLSKLHQLPLTHVDTIQFLPGMKIRPHAESIARLTLIESEPKWIIDGYGPLDIIERRFQAADRIVFIDFPIWRHYWWCTKRQIRNAWSRRDELPEGCDEFSYAQTVKLFQTLWRVHTKMRPQLLKIFGRDNLKHKMVWIRTPSDWKRLARTGIQE